jgi:dipeptidyl aminopeptidase/acylaminoacyl peptidase
MKKLTLALALASALATSTAAGAAAPTVTLQQDRQTIIYGGTLSLTGQVTPAAANQQVTITQTPMDRAPRSVTVRTESDGTFSYDASPRFNTRVVAKYGTATSDELNIWIKPRIVLSKYARHRFVVRVFAGRPFVGSFAWVQRWRAHAWRNLVRVRLTRYVRSGGASTVAFKLVVRRGTKLRAVVNNAAARPDYVANWSNFVVS